ncbi:MAG: alkaline phosphatase family protein [Acidiferrobacterales bacterium]
MRAHPLFLIFVFDALRPDMVTADLAPNLSRFIAEGCNFPCSRAVFPTSTYPNAVALATGTTPRKNGIISNRYFDPHVFHDRLFQPALGQHIAAGQDVYRGRLYTTPALGDLVAAAGYQTAAITTGSTGTSRPIDPMANERGNISLAFKDWAASTPAHVADALLRTYGPLPAAAHPNMEAIRLQTDILLEAIYGHYQPDIALVWFSDPDQTYHYCGVGSVESVEAIRNVDAQFGRILEWWRGSPLHDRLQVIAVSDHGHLSTIERVDVNAEAAKAGLKIGEHFTDGADYAGYTSYSGGLKVRDGDLERKRALVHWLMEQAWCGLIFTGGGDGIEGSIPGTYDHALVRLDHERTPDVSYIMHNNDGANDNGLVGRCYYNGDYPEGGGTHGGLHPKELNNVMATQGSLFKQGFESNYPAGIIDITPTILRLMGFPKPDSMDGRVLAEAFITADAEPPEPEVITRSVEYRARGQHLQYSQVGSTTYVDAGWLE